MTKPVWIEKAADGSGKGNLISCSHSWLRFNEFIYKILSKCISIKYIV